MKWTGKLELNVILSHIVDIRVDLRFNNVFW